MDGKLGDLIGELLIKNYIVKEYGLKNCGVSLKGNRIKLEFFLHGHKEFKEDHCKHVKADYADSLGISNHLELDVRFIYDVLDWYLQGGS